MSPEEFSMEYHINPEKIEMLDVKGLLPYICNPTVSEQECIERFCLIQTLQSAEMPTEELKRYMEIFDKSECLEERVRILTKGRWNLLDLIHQKQQTLDQIDYMIHCMKKTIEK